MSNLNPQQFGFEPYSSEAEAIAQQRGIFSRSVEVDLDLATPLVATQKRMRESSVAAMTENPGLRDAEGPPMVVKHGGRHYVWDGHHGIAAARRRGDRSMRVALYGEIDQR